MKRLKPEEVKERQIAILDFVADFCDKNGINYFLDSGTLIGAIRHKGYIPWDDDIDLGMLREDFERFKRIYDNNGRYKLSCYEYDKSSPYIFAKILDSETVLYEPDEKGIVSAINVDIFVYDNAPTDKDELNSKYKKCHRLHLLHVLQLGAFHPQTRLKKILRIVNIIALKIFPKNYFAKKLVEISREYENENIDYVGNFYGWSEKYCPKSLFSEYIYVEFEGKKYKSPIGYDEWLKSSYGNYMELPPESKRISHHKYKAYLR